MAQSPPKPKDAPKQADRTGNGEKVDSMFSPRFKSVAAMAGWDEEALLIASLVVEDTPDREFKQKKRSDPLFKTPSTSSRRKRRAQRRSPVSIPVAVLNLDEDETTTAREDSENKNPESKLNVNEEKEIEDDKSTAQSSGASSLSSGIPCLDRLREELSCAICLEICFEPSTTTCGHSFCKKCLRSAADKCGKRCPKCRQLISNGRSCTVNTVLWNTIQLLFPQEVEARKASGALNRRETERHSPARASNYNVRSRSMRALSSLEAEGRNLERVNNRNMRNRGGDLNVRRRRGVAIQDEDAALALTLQRQEFMDAFRGSDEQTLARENLRAMASRAINIRLRGRPT